MYVEACLTEPLDDPPALLHNVGLQDFWEGRPIFHLVAQVSLGSGLLIVKPKVVPQIDIVNHCPQHLQIPEPCFAAHLSADTCLAFFNKLDACV